MNYDITTTIKKIKNVLRYTVTMISERNMNNDNVRIYFSFIINICLG